MGGRLCFSEKWYAVGYRHGECGLPANPLPTNTDRQRRSAEPRPRSKNFRKLPIVDLPSRGPLSVDRGDPETRFEGFKKRVGGNTKYPSTPAALAALQKTAEYLASRFPRGEILSVEDWIRSCHQPQSWKDEVLAEWYANFGCRPDYRIARRVAGFIKLECYQLIKYARWINARCLAFKAYLGAYIRSIENVVYDFVLDDDVFSGKPFAKHIPRSSGIHPPVAGGFTDENLTAGISNLDDHVYYCKIASDWTSMEKHWKKERMLAIEWPLYRQQWWYLSDEEIRFIRRVLTGTNMIVGPDGEVYAVDATRMSGEMNTSLANGWCNFVVIYHIIKSKGGRFHGFVEGDDGIFASSVPVTDADYQSLGFDVKVETHESCSTASFCGVIAAPDRTLLKDPQRVLNKFGWTGSFIHAGEDTMYQLLRAQALSLKYEACDCPILGALSDYVIRETQGVTAKFVYDGYHELPPADLKLPPSAPTLTARVTFEQAFNIPVRTQIEAERFIQRGDFRSLDQLLPPMDGHNFNSDVAWYAAAYIERY